jgi:TatD DNase family protein
MIFDTHAHYDDEQFARDRDEVINRAYESGVHYIINASSDVASVGKSISLAHTYPFVYAAIGIHPHDVENTDGSTIDMLREYAGETKVVAIGEIGLDYHYDNSPRELQIKWFEKQLRLALELGLPVIIHDREAHKDCLDTVKNEKAGEVGGVFHCYSGSIEMAKELMDNNFYLSFGGTVTFKNARRVVEVVRYMPLDRLLIETDCPYLAPEPYRGKRNESSYLVHIIETIALIKNTNRDVVEEVTTENAKRLFDIS